MRGVRWLSVVVLSCALLLGITPAALASHGSLTLVASSSEVRFGQAVSLSGTLTRTDDGAPIPGQTVRIFDAAHTEVGSDVTDTEGVFGVSFVPNATSVLHAEWVDPDEPDHVMASPDVTIQVRLVVTVGIAEVRLFGEARVAGRVRPANPGQPVAVRLYRGSVLVATKSPVQASDGRFSVRFRIRRVGTYHARATFDDADHLPGAGRSGNRATPLPSLRAGTTNVFVLLLERRLRELRYRVPQPDRVFDHRTGDAVLAFNKVQGRIRVSYVTSSTWRALVVPRRPRPRSSARGLHVEVDKSKQILFLVRGGAVSDIVHVSTGRLPGWTREGVFRVFRKIAGYSGGRLYYPSYFDGLRAIHGWPEVPPYPASHGCVRVPMWTAQYLFARIPMATTVRIYSS